LSFGHINLELALIVDAEVILAEDVDRDKEVLFFAEL